MKMASRSMDLINNNNNNNNNNNKQTKKFARFLFCFCFFAVVLHDYNVHLMSDPEGNS